MRGWRLLGIFSLLYFSGLALQQAGEMMVQVGQHQTYGSYLTDAQGKSLYLLTNDTKNTSNCYDQCAQNWPPLLVQAKPTAGKGVAASLLGTTQRKDGKLQATYNGMPLYYYVKDIKAGDATGQGVGGVWFLVSPYGSAIKPPQQSAEAPRITTAEPMAATAQKPELMKQGEALFTVNCESCHGSRGEGGAGPALVGNRKLVDADFVIRQIMYGSRFMPKFGEKLSDKEVAAVATFIRESWGNSFGVILEEGVKKHR